MEHLDSENRTRNSLGRIHRPSGEVGIRRDKIESTKSLGTVNGQSGTNRITSCLPTIHTCGRLKSRVRSIKSDGQGTKEGFSQRPSVHGDIKHLPLFERQESFGTLL